MKHTARFLLVAATLVAASSAFADANSVAVNYQQGGKTIAGAYDGASTWANPDASLFTAGAVNATTFQGVTTWFKAGDYWSGATNPVADMIYRSDFGVNVAIDGTLAANTGGVTGSWGGMISATGLSQWMTANNYDSYTVTIYYASRNATTFLDLGHVYTGLTYSDANTLSGQTASYQFATPVGGWTSGSSYYGKSVSDALSADNLIVAFGQTPGITGGIAGMKIDGITAVPEPSAYGLIGAGALAAIAMVRRRRKSV